MKKDIVFLCQFFYPETVSSATLPFDTAQYLAANGYRVGALCGYPKEYSAQRNVPFRQTVDGVQIRRLKYIQLSRKSSIGRLINYFSFTMKAWLNIGSMKDSKAIVVYSNPPVLPIAALRAKKKYGTKLIFVAYDVYPEIAYASGAIAPGSILDKVMNWINGKLYSQADAVVALTDEMKQYLLSNRPELTEDRVFTIENWAHEKETVSLAPETAEKFGFTPDQFIVGYFGNLGTCQDIETMLQTAKLMKEDKDFGFLIVGHGNKKAYVQEFIAANGLSNVKVFDYLVGEEFQQAVALTSCTLVSLEPGLKGTCAPSKYYSCLLGGHPVIAVVEKGSYLAKEVAQADIGCHIENDDGEAFRNALLALRADPERLQQMSQKARALYAEKYDFPVAMAKYANLFQKVL